MPDTIDKHRKRLLTPYKRAGKAASVIASAKKLAYLILANTELLPSHRKKMLKEVLWLVSEADGKYSTRYRSAEVFRLAKEVDNCDERIQHEHVYPRAEVADQILRDCDTLLRNPERLDKLLDLTVGCVITKTEHEKLTKTGKGWERYESVLVLDMSTDPPSPLVGTGLAVHSGGTPPSATDFQHNHRSLT